MRTRAIAVLSVAALFAMLLAGCNGAGGQDTPTGGNSSQEPVSDGAVPVEETTEDFSALEYNKGGEGAPTVYMTTDISPEGLMAVYEALNWTPTGSVAVKLSTGEPPNSNYLRPELIADVVREVDGTIVECNTAYGGSRAQTAMHYQVAEDHGFTAIGDLAY